MSIRDIIQAIVASFRWVTKTVWKGGKLITKVVAERVAMPAIRAADRVVDFAVELPGRMLAPLARAKAAGAGPKTAQATQAAQQQVQQQSDQAAQTMSVAQQASLLQRAARFKELGHAWEEKFGDVLPPNALRYLRALTVHEAGLVAAADVRAVARIVSEGPDAAPIQGVRSVTEALAAPQQARDPSFSGGPAVAPTPVPGSEPADYSPAERQVLSRLSERLIARGRQPRSEGTEPDLGNALRA